MLVTLAGIAFPRYATAVARYRVSAAAYRIAQDLDLARGQSRLTSTSIMVLFSASSNSYQIVGMTDLSNRSQTYTVSMAASQYQATLAFSGFTGSTAVTFDHMGMPNTAGVVTVTVGVYKKTLTIDGATGKVTTQ